jgi:uncharacterized membrane protein YqjE
MADDAPPPPDKQPVDEPPSLLQTVRALLRDLPGLLTDRVRLLSLELRRASAALGQMVVLALTAAILVATAWAALWIGFGALFVAAGLGLVWACAIVLAINLLAAIWCAVRLRALIPLLSLPATLRHLAGADPRERAARDPSPDSPQEREDGHAARERDTAPAP